MLNLLPLQMLYAVRTHTQRLLFPLFLLLAVGARAQPTNDACSHAMPIAAGETLRSRDNRAASTTPSETPETQPNTCIKSYENDVWFSFTAEAQYTYYEVVIAPIECSSPAGLQALIIETADCDAKHFRYKACANPYRDDNLRLFLPNFRPQSRYLIYVDGYDGTECEFSISLIAHETPFTAFERLQHDYAPQDTAAPTDLSLEVAYRNNEMQLGWQDKTQSDVRGYIVEHLQGSGENRYGAIIGRVVPQQTAGNGTAFYTFVDTYTPIESGQTHCYRLVREGADYSLTYSPIACAEVTETVKSFWISPVYEEQQKPRTFVVQYDNRRKQTLAFRVIDQNKKVYKSFTLTNEPKGANTLTINMADFPPGEYFLETCGKDGCFLRAFSVR